MKLNYLTPFPLSQVMGGTDAVSALTYRELCKHFDVGFAVVPPPVLDGVRAWVSRFRRRVLRLPGRFVHFSPRRLAWVAEAVSRKCLEGHDALFFKGVSRWIACRPTQPYFAYTDVCFHTYFHNTFSPGAFFAWDLERIWRQEAAWLDRAEAVFFESDWGAAQARAAYGLAGHNFIAVGRGGNVSIPQEDRYSFKAPALVLIANDFRQKGGDLVWEVFQQLKPKYPELEWHIIGGQPDRPWTDVEGLHYHGFLRKTDAGQLQKFQSILEQAFLLVHPTREDCSPLVISEAGYFGCPSISVNQFAIPELIQHGVTGLLLEPPPQAGQLAAAVESLLQNPAAYREMRTKARAYALEHAHWETIGTKMARHMEACLRLRAAGRLSPVGGQDATG